MTSLPGMSLTVIARIGGWGGDAAGPHRHRCPGSERDGVPLCDKGALWMKNTSGKTVQMTVQDG